jgi:hypothetical protein
MWKVLGAEDYTVVRNLLLLTAIIGPSQEGPNYLPL